MIKTLITLFAVLVMLSGCVSRYSYEVTNDVLHIYLSEPDAEKVYFLSSLDQFERHEAFKNSKGIWEVTLPSKEEFKYFFIVDGTVFLPTCDQKENDDFGSENCIYVPE
ncbi:hypothetical protein OAC89_05335 [Deltaproteobacteria bacterium]|nr:hypothetical protein [Deltaproteobacteria bacterium]